MTTCKDCNHFDDTRKICRRYPPKIIPLNGYDSVERWPGVDLSDWCGEYKIIDKKEFDQTVKRLSRMSKLSE